MRPWNAFLAGALAVAAILMAALGHAWMAILNTAICALNLFIARQPR